MRPINEQPLDRPIRVVLFGGGPTLEPDVKRFICRLVDEPDIEFLAAFCQPGLRSLPAVIGDLWRRRRLLMPPLLLARSMGTVSRFVSDPGGTLATARTLARASDRIHSVADIHDPTVLHQVRSLDPDLGLIYGSPILRPALFEIPRFGTLGIHHGKMPEYRGKKTTFWAIANGEEHAGVTIQRINAGLDTGEIVRQGTVAIRGRPIRKVWRDVEALGLALYVRAILEVRSGVAVAQPNPRPKGKLYRDPTPSDLFNYYRRRMLGRFKL